MLLTLSVISSQSAELGNSAYRVFDAQGGTIGRVDANDWVLPDPAKFVSSHHARIRCHNNVFYLQDISTNGTFLNSTDTPVSKSDLTALGDGDRILIGDYEILVQLIDDGSAAATAEPAAPVSPAPAAAPAVPVWPLPSPVPSPSPAAMDEVEPESADPLLLLGGGPPPRAPAPLIPPAAPAPAPQARTPQPVQSAPPLKVPPPPPAPLAPPAPPAPVEMKPAVPPAASPALPPGGGIPDDWQLTGFNLSASSPARAAPERQEPNEAFAPAAPAPRPQPVAPAANLAGTLPPAAPRAPAPPLPAATAPLRSASGATDERIDALFKGLGVDPDRVSPETFAELGEILRIVVQGMIEVLQSRTEVKNNFRVPMTTMRPVENNPLKFSLNVDDAIHNLFVKRNPGYLQPVDAFREGFRDVSFHQVAMLAGIRTAFSALIDRFDPEGLEETYERKLKRTLLIGVATKLKYWDLYCEQFEEYGKDAEATFQNLFGEAFAKAYFEQLQQLATTARARSRR